MLRINKASEYGVMALRYIGDKGQAASAREISEGLKLPYELTAKTLQRLKDSKFIESSMGTKGGYILVRPLTEVSFAEVIDALEGPIAIVECAQHANNDCSRNSICELKDGMKILNDKIRDVLEATKLMELVSQEKRA